MAKPRMDLSAFVGKLLEEQDGDGVGDASDRPAKEVGGYTPGGVFVKFSEREFRHPIDRDEQVEPALLGPHLGEVDVDLSHRISLERPPGLRHVGRGQTVDGVALKEAM